MSKKKVVVALGHDALGSTTLAQLSAVKKTARPHRCACALQ